MIRRRGRKRSFTRAQAIAAALEVGLETFRLKDVADRLGVVTSALYREFDSRESLVLACLEHVARTAYPADLGPGLSWQQIVRDYANGTWAGCERYPGLSEVVPKTPGAHVFVQPYMRSIKQALIDAGIPAQPEGVELLLDFVGDTVMSTHFGVTHYRRINASGKSGAQQAQELFEGVSDTVLAPQQSWLERGLLDQKIEFIIRGVEAGHLRDLDA